MRAKLWCSVYLLTASWLFAVPYYVQPRLPIWIALLAAGSLLAAWAFRSVHVTVTRAGAAFLIPVVLAALLVPHPFNCGLVVAAVGLVCIVASRRAASAGAGLVVAGSILTAQSVVVAAYYVVAPRAGDLGPLAAVAGAGLRLIGVSARVGPEGLLLDNGMHTITYGLTADMFAVLALGVFAAGGCCALLLCAGRGKWRRVAVLLGATAAYAVVRFMLLALMFAASGRIDLFWSPGVTALSLVPLPLLLILVLGVRLRRDFLVHDPPLGNWKFWVAVASATLSVFALLGVFGFHDPGVRKQGRVVMDEGHSNWEWSTRAYDTTWYGQKSGYNYNCLYQYLDDFYDMKHNSGPITDQLLSQCDVLILKPLTKPLSAQEVGSIVRFVSAGGGLFLIGDHTNVFGSSTYVNPLAQKFGLRFNDDATYELTQGHLSEYRPPAAFPHPIVQYLPDFLFATSCSLTVSPGADAVITGYGLKALPADYSQQNFFSAVTNAPDMRFGLMLQGAAVRYGRGRVAAFTDSTVFSNFWMFMPGKPELALSYVGWLDRTNTRYGAAWVPLLFALGLAVPFSLVAPRLSRRDIVSALVVGALFAIPVAVHGYAQLDRRWYPLPNPRRDFIKVCFEQQYSKFTLPSTWAGFMADPRQSLQTFFVWNQRLGYVPSAEVTLDGALSAGDVVVVANPQRKPGADTIARVEAFVKRGGRLLVLGDDADTGDANAFLKPFGMTIGPSPALAGATCESQKGQRLRLTPSAGIVTGGTSLVATTTGQSLCSYSASGDGKVVAFSDRALFFNASLGDVSLVPNQQQRLIGGLEFSLMRFLADNESFAF
jgi:hypothetical protein